jgi:Lsr2
MISSARAAPVMPGLEQPGTSVWLRAHGARIVYAHVLNKPENGAAMAQKVQTLFIDDLDGSEADGTVRFALDGTDYEIDLNTKHAQELRDALAPFLSASRRVGSAARRPARSGRTAPASGLNTTEVREWAKTQGIDVKDRGRVPAELVVKFKAATGR